jgi:hypothetical protein
LYLLVIALLNNNVEWKYTFFFLPSLFTTLLINPFLLRKPFRPLATSLVILSNAYTFLQALYLLIRKRPLGWEASGVKQGGNSSHFTSFKLTAYINFLLLYVFTFGVILLNDKLEIGPSMLIVAIFLTSFVAHLGFLYYTLLWGITDRKHMYTDRKFFAAILMTIIVAATGVFGFRYHTEYNIAFGKHDTLTLVKKSSSPPLKTKKIHQ